MERTTLVVMTSDQTDGSAIKYSVYDALKCGFNKIVIVLSKENEIKFKVHVGSRLHKMCQANKAELCYAYQDMSSNSFGNTRKKRMNLGSGQAILAAKDYIDSQFLVINADTYYGDSAFEKMHDWLVDEHHDSVYGMAGFTLKETFNDRAAVTRGICRMKEGYSYIIEEVVETNNIVKTEDGCEADGVPIDREAYVSMNMWGFPRAFLKVLEDKFSTRFDREIPENLLNPEFLLSSIIGNLIREDICTLTVVETA